MADSASDKPERSAADKERSRQLSRPVSGKEAARTPGRSGRPQGRPGQGNQGRRGPQDRQGQRPQAGRGPAPRQTGRAGAQRPGQRRPQARRPAAPGRSRTNLFIWGAIGLVIVIVAVVVGVSQTSSPTTKGVHYNPTAVSATVLHEVTHVPTSAFNKVGTGIAGSINVPSVVSGQAALKIDGKPGVFGLFGEFCPYCAAERWSIIATLSRFGSFSGLRTMQSSPTDVYPRTQTFTFNTAKYTSAYIAASLLEYYGQDNSQGQHSVINKPTKEQVDLIKKYDSSGGTTRSGTIPFTDFGNKIIFAGASFNPNPLQTLSRSTIAASLKNPSNPVTKLILGTSNYMSAALCNLDGGNPGAVCSSAGVKAAGKALKISTT